MQYGEKNSASNETSNISNGRSSSSRLISKISLKMKVKWPLNIIIKPGDLDAYNKIFLFIMQIKQAKYELDSLDLKGTVQYNYNYEKEIINIIINIIIIINKKWI